MQVSARTITELRSLLGTDALSAEDLVGDYLNAIARHNPALHAVLMVDPSATAQARVFDRLPREKRGPLHGVPIVVKDNIDVAGLPTSSGCVALARAMPHGDAAQVARLRASGAVILAKTNLSEFSFEIRSRSSLGGDTRNPFRQDVTSGGSSGGTAVAVAAGFAAAGLGTDTGGSIRVPAAYNGLFGLRPTYGRLALDGVAPLAPSTDTIGPIARSVADLRLLWTVLTGDRHANGPVQGRRVGVLRQAWSMDDEIVAAAERACVWLGEAGVAIIDPVALPTALLPIEREHIVDAEFADAFDAYLASSFIPGTAPPSLSAILASGNYLPDHETVLRGRLHKRGAGRSAILAHHRALANGLEVLMAQFGLDALLYPTSQAFPASLANPASGWAPELAARSGRPALTVPMGLSRSGLPIGIELLGHAEGEAALFRFAAAIETRFGPRPLPPL